MVRRIIVGVLLTASFCSFVSAVEEAAPKNLVVPIQFFFSKKDSDLAACDKVLAEAVKQMPQIQIERISIDDPKGKAQVAELEKAHRITSPGDRSIFFAQYFLLSKGDQKDIEIYFIPMMHRLINELLGKKDYKDRLKPDVPAYAKKIFGKSATAVIEPKQEQTSPIIYYRVTKDSQFEGWIADAFDPIGCPVCNGAQFLLAADAKATILNVAPVRPIERIGTKIPEDEIEDYVKQFKGKSPAKPLPKVDGVARATHSTHAYMELIKAILEEFGKRLKIPPPAKK